MRDLINIVTEVEHKAQPDHGAFMLAAGHLPDMTVNLHYWRSDDCVFVAWINGSNNAVPRLCRLADEYGVNLKLSVEIYSQEDGGKLVPYYRDCGFVIDGYETGESFDENGNFDLSRIPLKSDELLDVIFMFRSSE